MIRQGNLDLSLLTFPLQFLDLLLTFPATLTIQADPLLPMGHQFRKASHPPDTAGQVDGLRRGHALDDDSMTSDDDLKLQAGMPHLLVTIKDGAPP